MSDVPSVVVDLASIVGQLVCSGLQNLGDDEWPLPGRSKLVAPLAAVAEATFKIIKTEFVWNETFHTLEELKIKLWDYV